MANYSIKADLLKLKGAFVSNLKGKTATKRCLCIPIDDSGLYLGQKGCYLNLTAIEMQNPQYGDSHCVKVAYDKDTYEKLNEEERKTLPILGGLHVIDRQQNTQVVTESVVAVDDEFPF